MKARNPDPARSLNVCHRLGAEDRGTLIQRDTYFKVTEGRLKLREEPEAVAQLIAYERADRAGSRESRYRLVAVPEPAALIEALKSTLGITVVVAKERRLFLFEGVPGRLWLWPRRPWMWGETRDRAGRHRGVRTPP